MADDVAQAKGPLVWLDMDQKALDDAYDQTVWAANQSLVQRRREAAANAAYARLAPRRMSYGETQIEGFDFYSCGRKGAPILCFIHGGAWRSGTSRDFAQLAEPYLAIGAHVAILDFVSIDAVHGELPVMVDQVRRAVAHIYRHAADFGGDQAKIFVAGHSSGGHLTGCVVTTDWEAYGLPRRILAGAVLMSGMYDLEPVRRSKRSLYVRFTDENVQALSAIRHLDKINCPLILAYGSEESPEFQRQTCAFHDAVQAAGKPVELLVLEGTNHFEMVESLANPYGFIGRAALAQVRTAAH
ncbi:MULTISPECIES: alpha/beta hydrolase [unclassified Beijerinckia]|uniref:alpha/beta hydrolase n=1 Tax=unclassified Beijerinckia TaxID=2638183 RepID=UPI00089CE008|nr:MULTISPECIES: alpha/beta hydrolase [unclassified Beijerinckia]MDH7799282.1 arylformamidase [Beijerinckia sp. GAS462]SED44764.1 arylformamidase [Beijerinckia sp. 28-YEA-48]